MVETEYKTAMVEEKTEYIITCKCDKCKKVISKVYGKEFNKLYPPLNALKRVSFYEVTTGHHDWGNDSCDSICYDDICPDCIGKIYKEYIEHSEDGVNTEYIKIEHKNEYSLPFEEDQADGI